MKSLIKRASILVLLFLATAWIRPLKAQPGYGGLYATFYDDLSPYGQWISVAPYGDVWQPDVAPDFRPYCSDGHWVWTEPYGWFWTSDYPWGWAAFHYGRWVYDDWYGWLWIPGDQWSPAWVVWRNGGGYFGWAPMGPGVNFGIDFDPDYYSPPARYWTFAPASYISSYRLGAYCLPYERNRVLLRETNVMGDYRRINNRYYSAGPSLREAQRLSRDPIRPLRVEERNRPERTEVERDMVRIYRPNPDDRSRWSNRGDQSANVPDRRNWNQPAAPTRPPVPAWNEGRQRGLPPATEQNPGFSRRPGDGNRREEHPSWNDNRPQNLPPSDNRSRGFYPDQGDRPAANPAPDWQNRQPSRPASRRFEGDQPRPMSLPSRQISPPTRPAEGMPARPTPPGFANRGAGRGRG